MTLSVVFFGIFSFAFSKFPICSIAIVCCALPIWLLQTESNSSLTFGLLNVKFSMAYFPFLATLYTSVGAWVGVGDSEIWLKLWNLVEILEFGCNSEIWLKFNNLVNILKFA